MAASGNCVVVALLVAFLAAATLADSPRRGSHRGRPGGRRGLALGALGSIGAGLGINLGLGLGHGNGHGGGLGHDHDYDYGSGSSSGSCRYWCRTPTRQYYCCEGGDEPSSHPTVKPGRCPPVRPQCPRVGVSFRPPTTCSHDSKCPGSEKCCYDTCLGHHTCKPPTGYY
ncbi:uncharacterized protein [Panulirus ornatus]|uniref:uncharacterized protein n=1 Tax=Panulirus ornatus TaxID=150431 RepID=UPI003A83D445